MSGTLSFILQMNFTGSRNQSMFRAVKYVQSRTDRVYKELQTLLKNGEKVLFSGTPCRVEAAKTIAKRFG